MDLTARVVADGDNRCMSFKTSPYIFGGSRYNFGVDQIELNKDVFMEVLEQSQIDKAPKLVDKAPTVNPEPAPEELPAEEKSKRRRTRKTEEV